MAQIGIAKTNLLFFKKTPPNNPTAIIGVKLGGCGIILDNAAKKIITIIAILSMFFNGDIIYRGVTSFAFSPFSSSTTSNSTS